MYRNLIGVSAVNIEINLNVSVCAAVAGNVDLKAVVVLVDYSSCIKDGCVPFGGILNVLDSDNFGEFGINLAISEFNVADLVGFSIV